jgi:LacI family transcriptional regulator
VIVQNTEGYGRGVLRGVASFAASRAWECLVQGVNAPADPREWDVDGLIAQVFDRPLARLVAAMHRPVVNVSSSLDPPPPASVMSDNLAIGRLGAEHLARAGSFSFAFYMPGSRSQYARLRHEGFSARLAELGHRATRLTDEGPELAKKLASLPRPLAVMAANDRAALPVVQACRAAGLRVPDDVAVLGVDNDDLIQSLCDPPLSSVNMATERIGFEAAAMLERLMQGEATPKMPRLVPPIEVIVRPSTDVLAISDGDVSQALRLIRQSAGRRLSIADLARELAISRRQLERRFRKAMGRSLHDEIRRCRVERARELLGRTELTIRQVADACGFSASSYLTVVFQRELGVTPGAYRRQFHRG